jgi:hypothetical protein
LGSVRRNVSPIRLSRDIPATCPAVITNGSRNAQHAVKANQPPTAQLKRARGMPQFSFAAAPRPNWTA